MKKIAAIVLLLCLLRPVLAQTPALNEWRAHMPYSIGMAVAEAGSRIYCGSQSGLFYYDKTDNELRTITRISGVSDIDISTIAYSKAAAVLVVAYANTNIDLIYPDGSIYNISDIKRKSILGKKTVNRIYCMGTTAFLSCGFGIVELDLVKREIKDTYFIGPEGEALEVNELTSDGTRFYAATEKGMYSALLTDNLVDYNNWMRVQGMPVARYNTVAYFNGKVYINRPVTEGTSSRDTLYALEQGTITRLSRFFDKEIRRLWSDYGRLLVTTSAGGIALDSSGAERELKGYYFIESPVQFISDKEGNYWVADQLAGMAEIFSGGGTRVFLPNGPFRNTVYAMASRFDRLVVASGSLSQILGRLYKRDGVYTFIDNSWNSINLFTSGAMDSLTDLVSVEIDPADADHYYVASWERGLVEMRGKEVENVFNDSNSSLQRHSSDPDYVISVGGVTFDPQGNLWVTNNGAVNSLAVRKTDGTWASFFVNNAIRNTFITQVVVDPFGQKWFFSRGNNPQMVIYNDNATIDDPSDDEHKSFPVRLNTGEGLKQVETLCLAVDRDGAVWAGTDYGIAVFYSPGDAFSEQFEPQQIAIQQDGLTQYLLESESVTAIAVDGANRKWVGTLGAGVFLFSPDGTREIFHFTEDNSPLLSNEIKSIAVNNSTGEVFFGTAKGIVSYRSSAVEPSETFKDVYAFPNPVPPGYEGTIGIKGLAGNVNVKIADAAGRIVYETRSEGGQAVWNGRTLDGEKASSGVYTVFCTSDDGQQTFSTKLILINRN
jgi:hypothetical protein